MFLFDNAAKGGKKKTQKKTKERSNAAGKEWIDKDGFVTRPVSHLVYDDILVVPEGEQITDMERQRWERRKNKNRILLVLM